MMLTTMVLLLFSFVGTSRPHVRPHIADFHIPSPAKIGDSVQLRCGYELGDEPLYSVKWYKDEIEFLRYVPQDEPQLVAFPIFGITVDVNKSNGSSVILRNVRPESSGNYTCEIYTDAPYFGTMQETQELIVVASRSNVRPHIADFHIPSPAKTGDSLLLRCGYELGDEPLNSVKWYKDGMEFLRYVPHEKPMLMTFPLYGLNVDVNTSNGSSVFLRNVRPESSGNYTCEIYTEAPHFSKLQETQKLIVIASRPHVRPHIADFHIPSTAKSGDSVRLSCGYDLGDEPLYSVKWYKDEMEIFRYNPVPEGRPMLMAFAPHGLNVDMNESNDKSVFLRNVSSESSGNYTCEVHTGAPHFRRLHRTRELIVINPPSNELLNPPPVVTIESVRLRCSHETLANETVHSIRWFLDAVEFLRYVPSSDPPFVPFPQDGIHVDLARSDGYTVLLRNLKIKNFGNFTCEVSERKQDSSKEASTEPKQVEETSSSHGCLQREQESCMRSSLSLNFPETSEGMDSYCRFVLSYYECMIDAARKCDEAGTEKMARIQKHLLYLSHVICNVDNQTHRETSSSNGCLLREQESCVRPNASWNFHETKEGMDSYCRHTINYLECKIDAANNCDEAGSEDMARIRKRQLYLRDELCNEDSQIHRVIASNLQCISQTFRSVPEACSSVTQRTDYLISAIESRIDRPSAIQPGFCWSMLVSYSCAALAFEKSCGESVGAAFVSAIVTLESDFELCPPEVAAQLPQAMEAYRSIVEDEKEAAGATSRRRK